MTARALAVAAVLCLLTGCGSTHPARSAHPAPHRQGPVAGAGLLAAGTMRPVRPMPPHRHRPRPALPDGSRRLLPGHRVVAYYGAAGTPVLGVLGSGSPEHVWPRLARQARAYRRARTPVLPAYELIAFVATGGRGNTGHYSTRVSDRVIGRYAAAARRHHALLLLDVQPGRGSFLHDAKTLRHWLLRPDVGLAIDPEWKLYGRQRPLQRIGHTDAITVNAVSGWLDRLTSAHRLPQKLFVVHEFTDTMVLHKRAVRHRRHLATVFNVDGFGSRSAKLGKYAGFAARRRFPLGFKLFYDKDVHLLGPVRVLRMRPAPALVEYQ